jgi:uncharacterized peroxidase-related enzyme
MSFITLNNQLPGIVGLFAFSPKTAGPMSELAEQLLRADHPTLSRGERELIAAFVSKINSTEFCAQSHRAFAEYYLGEETVAAGLELKGLSEKMTCLMRLARFTAYNEVTHEQIAGCKGAGCTDQEIHDVILIAASFAMYNRYVKNLGVAEQGLPKEAYQGMATMIVENGYVQPNHVTQGSDIMAEEAVL